MSMSQEVEALLRLAAERASAEVMASSLPHTAGGISFLGMPVSLAAPTETKTLSGMCNAFILGGGFYD
jgi:hypothetical protein